MQLFNVKTSVRNVALMRFFILFDELLCCVFSVSLMVSMPTLFVIWSKMILRLDSCMISANAFVSKVHMKYFYRMGELIDHFENVSIVS